MMRRLWRATSELLSFRKNNLVPYLNKKNLSLINGLEIRKKEVE